MHSHHARKEAGFTFAELAFSMLILVIGAAVLINHLAINYQTTNTERDRIFAYAKAQAILSEIQNLVDRGGVDAAVDLDVLDDGVTPKFPLTIATDNTGYTVTPDHLLSGNYQRDGRWVWSRLISVQPFTGLNNRNVRYVTVRIYRRDKAGNDQAMADLSAVINSAAAAFPTTQVFDVYLLAVENIPGWWVYMDTIRPFVESMITDLESRNPGLEFRTHWITKSAFGRNAGYRPHFNETLDSLEPPPGVYHYPGKMPEGSASVYYYVPNNVRAHVDLDGLDANGHDASLNPYPYALADYFNHAMRQPAELALWQSRVAAIEAREDAIEAALAAGLPPPSELTDMSKEPTLRLFLDDLSTNPDKYRNAMVINLHGELLPVPALRNYSDAARDPVNHPEIRVVTHPEELRTERDSDDPDSSDDVVFRMYAYNTNTQTYSGPAIMADPMVVDVMGLDLTDPANPTELGSDCDLSNIRGGVTIGGPFGDDYPNDWEDAHHEDEPGIVTNEMYYRAQFVDPGGAGERFTRIFLYNTPVVCPLDGNGRGLASTKRANLYWMPYVPCPVEAERDFSTDLTTVNTVLPKNTARWKLEIDADVFSNNRFVNTAGVYYSPGDDVVVSARTRIWSGSDPETTGTMWPSSGRNMPDNLSTTYTWWADSTDDVPVTERSQFIGDPRHCPYKDCFDGADDFPNSYNWFHNDFYDGAVFGVLDYPSIEPFRVRDRWNNALSCDVPRYMELYRRGLTDSACLFTTLTGYSYYYLGVGNEIGYDAANGYANSIPVNKVPFGGAGTGYMDTIRNHRRLVRTAGSGTYWWGMPWLGELYPDSEVGTWTAEDALGVMRGNLDPGNGTSLYYQDRATRTHNQSNRQAYGTKLRKTIQRTATRGCIAFFNIGSPGATFDHIPGSANGTPTAEGEEIASNYNFELPAEAPISRPFSLTDNAYPAEEWNFDPYDAERFTASLFKTYYNHPLGTGSGLVKLVEPGDTAASYIVVNGIDKTIESGTSFIAKWALLTLTHSFFEAGDAGNSLRIPQLPRVEIAYPNDISELLGLTEIVIQYGVDWTRWDGLPYTESGTFSESETELEYVIMYSDDGGGTWRYVQDRTVATPSIRPTDPAYLVPDLSVGDETFTWSVPASLFPQGSYVLRIDCFRHAASVHYSYHRTKIYIQR